MRDTTLRDHLVIVEQLPDFVLGKLDETSLRRVSRHLGDCATCRDELSNAINVLGVLAIEPPPRAAVRDAILRRAVAQPPVKQTVIPGTTLAESRSVGGAGQSLASAQRYHSRVSTGPLIPGWALVAAAAAILLVSGSVGWGYENEQSNSSAVIADIPISLVDDSATAYLLDDSDLPVSATGVVFAEPQAREVYLVANGLPALSPDQRYQVWLFTTDDKQQSAGLLAVGADGDVRVFLETSAPFAHYVGLALTAEPATGSAAPTSDLVLGGSFPPALAALPSSPS